MQTRAEPAEASQTGAAPAISSASPKIFSALNGLRGLAAISVLLFHRRHWFGEGFLLPDAYLAVDFFFILSGFVISGAYAPKLTGGLPFGAFLVRRFNRLMPLVFISGALEAVVTIARAHQTHTPLPGDFVPAVLCALTTLPALWQMDAWQMNPPEWSLFLELFVNVLFAAVLVGFRRDVSKLVAALAFLPFLILTPHIYGGPPDWTSQIPYGFVRVIFFFFLGAVLFQVHDRGIFRRVKLNLFVGAAILMLSFAVHDEWAVGPWLRLAFLVVAYPLVIIGGANAEPSGWLRRVSEALGDLSYPLYILQIPILGMIAGAATFVGLRQEASSIPEALIRFALVGVGAWVILKVVDEPVRARLDRWARGRRPARKPAANEA